MNPVPVMALVERKVEAGKVSYVTITTTETTLPPDTTSTEPTPTSTERTGGFTRQGGPGLESEEESTRSRIGREDDTDSDEADPDRSSDDEGRPDSTVRPTVTWQLPTFPSGRPG